MSAKEVQDMVHQLGVFMFRGGKINEGMLVARYNIPEARIEYYFIHRADINDYRKAKGAHDPNAHLRLGEPVDVNSIIKAQLFN